MASSQGKGAIFDLDGTLLDSMALDQLTSISFKTRH